MPKSANVYARIEPALKEQAETILNALGLSSSGAITMFYRQIVMQKGLPFDVKLPSHPLDMSKMSEDELDAALDTGYRQALAGQSRSTDDVFADMERDYGI